MITNTFIKCILPNNGKLLNALAFVLVLSFSFNVGADAHGENPAVSLEVAS